MTNEHCAKAHTWFIPGFIAAALLMACGFAAAEDGVLLALNTPAKPAIETLASGLASQTTAQLDGAMETTDFDAFSAVNDPLYREGSKEFLEQAIKADGAASDKAALRDAPADVKGKAAVPAVKAASPAARKAKAARPVKADPVQTKKAL